MPSPSPQPATRAAAAISACGRWRWWLHRGWDPTLPVLLFIGLNPSSADARRDDPTLRRLIGLARGWGYGGLEVVNLFSFRSASPLALRRCADPVGRETDSWIRRRIRAQLRQWERGPAGRLPAIWLGWGNGGGWAGRADQLGRLLAEEGPQRSGALGAIGLTRRGQPRHPLYAPAGARLTPWPPPSAPPAGSGDAGAF